MSWSQGTSEKTERFGKVKALSLTHELTANQLHPKPTAGSVVAESLLDMNLWNFPIDYLNVVPMFFNQLS